MIYKKGYHYQLACLEVFQTSILPPADINLDYLSLSTSGKLILRKGYAWDGATWFPDIKTIMTPSAGHDALYQLIRLGYLSEKDRHIADQDFHRWCINAGMWKWLAHKVFLGVFLFASGAAKRGTEKEFLCAPSV